MSATAGEVLRADLETRRPTLAGRVYWLVEVLLSDSVTEGRPLDLVVRRIETGAEIIRTKADLGDPFILLDQVRDDLAARSVEEFLDEWRIRD